MTSLTEILTLVLSSLTVLGQVFILAVLVQSFTQSGRDSLRKLFSPAIFLGLGFAVSGIALIGTLYFSEIAGFAVCKLCWAQRIFLYPEAIILAIAFYKNDFKVAIYSIPLALFGIFFSAYHYLVQATEGGVSCGTTGASCSKIYITGFDYITFPVMSATAFALIIVFSGLAYFGHKASS